MRIYNRWGELIFESTDVNRGWDGKSKNINVAEGVYVYTVNYNLKGICEQKTGHVSLIR